VTGELSGLPWMAAWQSTQRHFTALAAGQPLADQYRLLFALHEPSAVTAAADTSGAAWVRYQAAARRFGQVLSAIASDAERRLEAALAEDGPDATPITTLRELHSLWIECGDAAWSAAAHGEEFATAQADWLAALVELRPAGAAR
jgi:hypothetical protein